MTLASAVRGLNQALAEHLDAQRFAGNGDVNNELNRASRDVVFAMRAEHGHAWLLDVNKGTYVEWDGASPVLNFCASHVLPHDNAVVRALVEGRLAAPYTGVSADMERVTTIGAAVKVAGGEVLLWD